MIMLMPQDNISQKTILAIDDDEDILKIITLTLKSAGYLVVTATDGYMGLLKVKSHNPALIIVDLTMPDLNGWKFSQILRQDEKFAAFKDIPIIVLSALIEEEGPTGNKSSGDYYLAKPFEGPKLLSIIKEFLKP